MRQTLISRWGGWVILTKLPKRSCSSPRMTAALLLGSNCSSMGVRLRSKESCSWAPHRDVHDTVHTAHNPYKRGLPDPQECSYDEREEMQKVTPRDKKNISLSTCWQRWYLRDEQVKKHERDAYSGMQT